MKIVDIKLTNFKKLSNIPQPTISFNDDITVLVGANNAGKTSILKAIQKLFRTEAVDPTNDLNYLVEDGTLLIEATLTLTKNQWQSYLRLALGSLRQSELEFNTEEFAHLLFETPVFVKHHIGYINRKQSNYTISIAIDKGVLDGISKFPKQRQVIQAALNLLGSSDIFNVYHTPLYLDSKGEIQEQEQFIPLSQIKNQRGNNNKVNIRGLLYALKKKDTQQFEAFKRRLLDIFTELENIDVRHNEELGQFELVLSEKLKKNGDSKQVDYDIKNTGQGMQTLVLMLANVLLLEPNIVLMDEPEVHMHPSLIKEFVKYIKQLSVDTQFIITTHSVVLMSEVGLNKLVSLKYEVEQKGVIATPVEGRNKFLDAVNALGYSVDALTYTLKPKVFVFTEGPSDEKLILAFAAKKGLSHDLNASTVGFISMGGKGNRYRLAELIDKMNKEFIDSPLIMILDRDETPSEQVEDIKRKFFNKNPKRLHYLSKRQIENYLLDEKAIQNYVAGRIRQPELAEKWRQVNVRDKFLEFAELQRDRLLRNFLSEIFIDVSLIDTPKIRKVIDSFRDKPLNESVPEFVGEVSKQVSMRTFGLGQKTTSSVTEFEERWKDPSSKLEMIDGRELLTVFRQWTQKEFKVSFSNDEIINQMDALPEEIDALISQLQKPEELKI